MTNEDAVNMIGQLRMYISGGGVIDRKLDEAVQMAIEALQRETSGDAISREAVSAWLKQYGQDVLHGKYKFSLMYIWKNIMELPSVQPVAKDINVSCKDAISRQDAIDAVDKLSDKPIGYLESAIDVLVDLPSVQPHTDEEIQKIQELEQTQLDKAFELGKESARAEIIHCGECKHKGTKNCVANVWAAILGVTVKDDFYCGLAERRTDERSN